VVAQAPPSTTSTAYSNTTPAVLEYVRDLTVKEVKASPGARPLVVLPGFGNNTVDYTAPFGDRSLALTTHLEVRDVKPKPCYSSSLDWRCCAQRWRVSTR
jgi:hypothetical protein